MAASLLVLCALLASYVTAQMMVDVETSDSVVNAGDSFTMICRVHYPLTNCQIEIGGKIYSLSPDSNDDVYPYQYRGNGLQNGQCGVEILHVKEADHGNISCIIPGEETRESHKESRWLTITQAPGEPSFVPSPGANGRQFYQEGELLEVMCVVPHSRPRANISWYLGEDMLTEGLHQLVTHEERSTDLVRTTQNLTRKLIASDNGKRLTCQAEHKALGSPLTVSTTLDVQYAPNQVRSPIQLFGIKLYEEGRLNVTIEANPRPNIVWYIDGNPLQEGHESGDRNLMAEPLVHVPGGFFATLLIRSVQMDDIKKRYVLEASNAHGEAKYNVEISTNDEPEAQLSTGGIVGIVIAILVLVIAVTLVVLARKTHRWCFAGTSHTEKPDGDSEAPVTPHMDHDLGIKGSENPTHNGSSELINGHGEKKPDTAV